MAVEKLTTQMDEQTARRDFLKKVGQAAASAPAVALLLAASSKPASAQDIYGPDESTDGLTPDGSPEGS